MGGFCGGQGRDGHGDGIAWWVLLFLLLYCGLVWFGLGVRGGALTGCRKVGSGGSFWTDRGGWMVIGERGRVVGGRYCCV